MVVSFARRSDGVWRTCWYAPPTPHGIVDTASELTTVLQEQGFVVQDGGPFSDFLFEREGQLLRVNGKEVWIWEFETVAAADGARLFLNGEDSPWHTWSSVPRPVFCKTDK